MKEITTDLWSLHIGEEWFAEQDEETIIISDEDEVSLIEISCVKASKENTVSDVIAEMLNGEQPFGVLLSDLEAFYREFIDEGMFWREWLCPLDDQLLIVSHGCDESNQGIDNAAVDEILASLYLLETNK